MLLDLFGDAGTGPRGGTGWQLRSASGAMLPAGASLDDLGVLDGDLLRLQPVAAPHPAPVFDDPVDVLAHVAAARPCADGRGFVTAAVLVLTAAAAVLLGGVRTAEAGDAMIAVTVALAGLEIGRAHV